MGGGAKIYLLHKVELVRSVVEKRVEGIPLCHDMQERTWRGSSRGNFATLIPTCSHQF